MNGVITCVVVCALIKNTPDYRFMPNRDYVMSSMEAAMYESCKEDIGRLRKRLNVECECDGPPEYKECEATPGTVCLSAGGK